MYNAKHINKINPFSVAMYFFSLHRDLSDFTSNGFNNLDSKEIEEYMKDLFDRKYKCPKSRSEQDFSFAAITMPLHEKYECIAFIQDYIRSMTRPYVF